MAVIPFYGATDPDMFAIERAAMDRAGHVTARLDQLLPSGIVADIGAGDGFTAERLQRPGRQMAAVEPASGMVRPDRNVIWVRADAAQLPFADGSFSAAYSTWAYFFSRGWDPTPGLNELHRVVAAGGPLLIVDNAGGDEFSELTPADISADAGFWTERGFQTELIETAFEFESAKQARTLLEFFFGAGGPERSQMRVGFNVYLFRGRSRGPDTVPS